MLPAVLWLVCIIDKLWDRAMNKEQLKLCSDWFGDNDFRELNIGEKITVGDVFIQDSHIYQASDIGNGRYSGDHFPHYRCIKQLVMESEES
jgi:hypothetical protein